MPTETWEELVGLKCADCSGYATHFDELGVPFCCDCHGSFNIHQKDAKREHERVIISKDHELHEKMRKNPDEIGLF